MKAIVECFANPAVQPYIEPDQTENILLRHLVSYYSINPATVERLLVETKVSPADIVAQMKSKVTDQIIAVALQVYGPGSLVKQDVIFPDFTRG